MPDVGLHAFAVKERGRREAQGRSERSGDLLVGVRVARIGHRVRFEKGRSGVTVVIKTDAEIWFEAAAEKRVSVEREYMLASGLPYLYTTTRVAYPKTRSDNFNKRRARQLEQERMALYAADGLRNWPDGSSPWCSCSLG